MSENNIDVMCLCETWFISDEFYGVPEGYQILRKDRQKRGGGVAILVKDNLKVKEVSLADLDFKQPTSLEALCITLQSGFHQQMYLCSVYRTKNPKNDLCNLDSLMTFLSTKNRRILLLVT